MTTHALEPRRGAVHGRFGASIQPILTIEPGDTVVYRTLDASWGGMGAKWFDEPRPEVGRDPERDRGHALTGPIAVRGAMPGDVLEIRIGEIRPGPWGWTWAGPMENRTRQYSGLEDDAGIGWRIDPDAGTATDIHGYGLTIPLRPFMGVMGNAPAGPDEVPTAPPRRVGGNLDCRELVTGSTLWLPIEVEGALFSVGDGHGAQGDGEIGSTGIECPMERVELTFRLRRDMAIDAPCAETPAGFLTLGFGADLDDATEAALSSMLEHLRRLHGWTRSEAAVLASLAVDLRVTQIVNGTVGVHAVLPPNSYTKA
jgi:acetamidase/formamidase